MDRKNQMTEQTKLINISSVVQESIKDDEMQIVARWKESKEKTISPANRVRAIVIPANLWNNEMQSELHKDENVNKQLRLFVLDGIADLAKQYLSSIVEESNWQRSSVNLDAFTLRALLQWQSDQAAISGRLNGEEIRKWIASSATVTAVSTSHGAAVAKALGEQFIKLASPNHGLTPEKAAKLLSSLWKVEDADSTTGLRVLLRLKAISEKTADSANVLDSIL